MHKNSFVLCGLACIAGVFGAFSRWLQNTTAFEPDTGLTIPNSLWNIVMAVYMALIALVLIFVVRWLKNNKKFSAQLSFPEAFRGGPMVCTVTAALSGLLIAAGGVAALAGSLGGGITLGLVEGVFAIAAAVCVFMVLKNVNADSSKGSSGAFITIVLYLCFRLINEYKMSASDPVVWDFTIRILAVCAMIMAYYYFAGYCFGRAKPYRALYFSFLGIFLSIITFADGVSLSYHLVTAGLILAQLVLTLLLVGNMTHPAHDGTLREE